MGLGLDRFSVDFFLEVDSVVTILNGDDSGTEGAGRERISV